jgi:putative acetyltransferase
VNAEPSAGANSLRERIDGDWPALADMWVAAWRATYAEIDFDARRDWLTRHVLALETKGARTFVLTRPAPICLAGFVVIDPASCWLDQLCVHPALFGSDAAQELLAAAREISPWRIRLDVNADNFRALRFYERHGFLRIGEGRPSLSGRTTLLMEWRPA